MLISLVIFLVIVGVLLYIVPVDTGIRNIIIAVIALIVFLVILNLFNIGPKIPGLGR